MSYVTVTVVDPIREGRIVTGPVDVIPPPDDEGGWDLECAPAGDDNERGDHVPTG